jgi:hypothetical protein
LYFNTRKFIMTAIYNVMEALDDVERFAEPFYEPLFIHQKFNQLRTVYRRFLAAAWRGEPFITGAKATEEQSAAADAFLATQPVDRFRTAVEDLQTGLQMMGASPASRNNYTSVLAWFLELAKQRAWYPLAPSLNIQDQCCPPRYLSGRRHSSNLPLTERTGHYEQYRLIEGETSPALQTELDDLYRYWTASVYPGRVRKVIKPQTADSYMKDVRLMLGYVQDKLGIPLSELRLKHLVPLVTPEQLEELTKKQQDDLWYEHQLYLEGWIGEYFQDIQQWNNSLSPRTKNGKLNALARTAHYLYRRQVRRKRDYDAIPIFMNLAEMTSLVNVDLQRWLRTKTTVADVSRKWPDVVEGETALTTVRRLVVEPLRKQSRLRRKNGAYRVGDVIAKSHQHYLKWAFVTDLPTRRQRVYRLSKIALSCPLARPDSVPPDGCYFPLPPNGIREKNNDGTLADNYLCKVYAYKDRVYPEGVWILQVCADKTDDVYGIYAMEIPNRTFEDGTCFYEYLERYLCGCWVPGKFSDRMAYGWWDPSLQGQVGHWVTKGWMEFEPSETYEVEERARGPLWRWGFLFPMPETGKVGDGTVFGGSFLRTSYQLIGKRITPHLVRNFWATWAFQVKLTDAEVASLAYAMGHSVKTLKEIYERCTEQEKARPIYEAIDRHLFQHLDQSSEVSEIVMDPLQIVEELRKLSPEERQKIVRLANAG